MLQTEHVRNFEKAKVNISSCSPSSNLLAKRPVTSTLLSATCNKFSDSWAMRPKARALALADSQSFSLVSSYLSFNQDKRTPAKTDPKDLESLDSQQGVSLRSATGPQQRRLRGPNRTLHVPNPLRVHSPNSLLNRVVHFRAVQLQFLEVGQHVEIPHNPQLVRLVTPHPLKYLLSYLRHAYFRPQLRGETLPLLHLPQLVKHSPNPLLPHSHNLAKHWAGAKAWRGDVLRRCLWVIHYHD